MDNVAKNAIHAIVKNFKEISVFDFVSLAYL